MNPLRSLAGAACCLAVVLAVEPTGPLSAQTVPSPAQIVPPPAKVESQPLAPLAQPAPPAAPGPAQAPAPLSAPAPAPPAAASPAPAPSVAQPGTVTTLAPPPADPSMPDEVQLASRPALTVQGQATWDDGYDTLMAAFARLKSEAAKAVLAVTGLPLATFLETDDLGFRFEAQLPVASLPAARPPAMAREIGFGATPAGRAIRFSHRGPYDDIDSTYEAITAYLDSKGIEVKENFTEEYVNPGSNAGDSALEIFIYVLPK